MTSFVNVISPQPYKSSLLTSYLVIDSRYRDNAQFPDPNKFVVNLNPVFKNVVSVELVYAVYDKIGTERYVNLFIDEVDAPLVSNNEVIGGAFTQLPLIDPVNIYRVYDSYRSIKNYDPPSAKLSRMTISLKSANGDLYPIRDMLMRFEITCLVAKFGS